MPEMRFGVSLAGWPDGPALLAAARTAEREGFDAVTVADHLGHTAPFAVLAAAAAVTSRVRLRTYVLDATSGTPRCSRARSPRWTGCPAAGWSWGSARDTCGTSTSTPGCRSRRWMSGGGTPRRCSPRCGGASPTRRTFCVRPAAGAGDGGGHGRAGAAGRGRSTPTSSAWRGRCRLRAGPPGTFTLTDAATDRQEGWVGSSAGRRRTWPRPGAGRAVAAGGARRGAAGDRGNRGAGGRRARDGLADAATAAGHALRAVRRVRGGGRRGARAPGAPAAALEHACPRRHGSRRRRVRSVGPGLQHGGLTAVGLEQGHPAAIRLRARCQRSGVRLRQKSPPKSTAEVAPPESPPASSMPGSSPATVPAARVAARRRPSRRRRWPRRSPCR